MALAETLTYNDVVDWLVTGTVNYCYNVTPTGGTSRYNQLPECMRVANWSKRATLYQGSVSGKHGHQKGRCYIDIALNPGSSNIKSYAQSTVKTNVQNYIKKVDSTLSNTVPNNKIQKLFAMIISYCNDNIKIATCTCPGFVDLNKIYYAQYPVYGADSVGSVTFNTNIVITANEMIKSLNDFSAFYRKYSHPKVISLTYSVSTHS